MTMSSFTAHSSDGNAPSPPYDISNPIVLVGQLKTTRNSVIGSRTRKSHLVNNGSIKEYVRLLNLDLDSSVQAPEIVALSATIIASLANTPAHHTLLQLLRAGAHDAFLACLKRLVAHIKNTGQHLLTSSSLSSSSTLELLKLLEALLRALRSILLAIADQLSASPRWGIGSAWGTKSVSSGVSLSNHNPAAGGTKIFGKSSRESLGSNAFSFGTRRQSDVSMSSDSIQDLRASAQADAKQEEADQLHELRLFSRAFLARVYSVENFPYLVGPLFVCRVPQQNPSQHGHSTVGDITMRSRASSSVGLSSPALRLASSFDSYANDPMASSFTTQDSAFNASYDSLVNVDSLPLSTRSRILSIIEMICATLAGTIYIPGPGPTDSASVYDQDDAKTPEGEISRRRLMALSFSADSSPFVTYKHPNLSKATEAEDANRGRTEDSISSRKAAGFQAELLRKGSRSRSRMQDLFHSSSADSSHPPLLKEEERVVFAQHPTILSVLLACSECGFVKVQEAALWCLAELTRESPEATERLFRGGTPSRALPTSMLLSLRKSSSPNVRLAAFCCLAHIIRIHPFTPKTNQCVLEVLLEFMDQPSTGVAGLQAQGQVQIQVQAAFAVARLVADDTELQSLAADGYGALQKLTSLLDQACNQSNGAGGGSTRGSLSGRQLPGPSLANPTLGVAPSTVDEGFIRLREACLTALASLIFQQDDLRRKMIDACTPSVLSMVVPCLNFPALGVRVAACRLIRALSRSISILRTSLVDAGVAEKLLGLLNDEEEDEAVKVEATAAICNLVLNFSPVKKLVTELGGVEKLVSLAHRASAPSSAARRETPASSRKGYVLSDSQELRLNALWAIKNILWASETSVKAEIMEKLGWDLVVNLAAEGEMLLREQALNILRNVASSKEEDITLMINGVGGQNKLLDLLEKVIWDCKDGGNEGASVIEQAAYCLVNVATGTEDHRRMILRRPNLMDALIFFTNHPWKDIRVAACWCVINLAYRPIGSSGGGNDTSEPDVSTEAISRLGAFGMEDRLRTLSKDESDLDVRDRARAALARFEQGSSPSSSIGNAGGWMHPTAPSGV